jgi:cell division septum initiation protein DivIVA
MSKLLVAIVQLFISLKLINGYKLCDLKMLNQMATMHLDLEENIVELKENLQEKTDEATVYSTQMTNALAQRDDAEKRCIAFDEIGRNVIKQLKIREAEIKLAASEILVLKESQAEATDISKQLKEALDRWTS